MNKPVRNDDLHCENLQRFSSVDSEHLVRLDIFARGAELKIILKLCWIHIFFVCLLHFILVTRLLLGSLDLQDQMTVSLEAPDEFRRVRVMDDDVSEYWTKIMIEDYS